MGYVQKINMAKLTSICLTDKSNPEVKRIDPNVINKKSERFSWYVFSKFFWKGINGIIIALAKKYLNIIAILTPTPKLNAIFVVGANIPKKKPAPRAKKIPISCILC